MIKKPVKLIWEYVTNSQNVPEFYKGYGPIPGIKKIEIISGKPMTSGMKQRTTTLSGMVLEELFFDVEKYKHVRYELLSGFGFPFNLIVRKGGGAWTFTEDKTGTTIVWDYYFELTSLLMYLLGWLAVAVFHNRNMNNALENIKRKLEPRG